MKNFFILSLFLVMGLFSPVRAQKQSQTSAYNDLKGLHPVISDILTTISKDSIRANMQWMVDMGTRYMYGDNRREVADQIALKFRSYGFTRVELDSFKIAGEIISLDSVWQYNVVASLTGSSAPGEISIISAHHDNYRNDSAFSTIPGADDNASGCAVLLEIARVLKEKEFQPASTIRFVTFAAEELTGYQNYSGSIYYAKKIFADQEDLRLVINNDMVAYVQDSTNTLFGSVLNDPVDAWLGELMLASTSLYAPSLNVMPGEYPTSDATYFHTLGFPVTGFQEFGLNPTYHTINDSVSKCNLDICTEVTRSCAAILLNEQLTPVPQLPEALCGKSSVTLNWRPTENSNVAGYRIYRSTFPDSAFSLIGETGQKIFTFRDSAALAGIQYYYSVTSFDNLQYESIRTNIISGAICSGEKELLVVKDSHGGFGNPSDSVVNAYYSRIFRDVKYDFSDASVTDSLDLGTLGRYQKIFWLSNTNAAQPNSSFRRNAEAVTTYLRSGGQLFIAGFCPTFMISGNTSMDMTFNSTETVFNTYKINNVLRKPNAYLNGAWPCSAEYDSIHIDTSKCLPNAPNHIYNLESIDPAPEAKIIYRFNSAFDTTSVFGKMKGKPVGFEYLGEDFRLIILSVPLYYMDSLEAKKLSELILNQKFIAHVGTEEKAASGNKSISLKPVPNPFREKVSLQFELPVEGSLILSVFDILGNEIFSSNKGIMQPGSHTVSIDLSGHPGGVYTIRLCSGPGAGSVKIVKAD